MAWPPTLTVPSGIIAWASIGAANGIDAARIEANRVERFMVVISWFRLGGH
jgi:hypothetical protein